MLWLKTLAQICETVALLQDGCSDCVQSVARAYAGVYHGPLQWIFGTLVVWTVSVAVPSVGLVWQRALRQLFQLAHGVKHQDSFYFCLRVRQETTVCISLHCNPHRRL